MEPIKPSVIQLESIALEGFSFIKKAEALQHTTIPPRLLQFDVAVEVLRDTLIQSRCEISVLKDENQEDFEVRIVYLITASITDAAQKDALEKFSRFGAPFNALVYARELIANVTSRAFGIPAMLPLLDIQQLGASITFKSEEQEPHQSLPDEPQQPAE